MNEESDDEPKKDDESLGTRSEVEVLGTCKRRVKASVPVEKVREELDRNYKELASTVQLPGFRRGRIPRKLLEARFGEEIEGDVKQSLLSGSLAEVVEQKELKVIGSPSFSEVQFNKDMDLSYTVELEVRPEFELTEYKGIEVTRESAAVTDDDVEERIKSLQRKAAKLVPVDPASAGLDGVYAGKYSLTRDGEKVKSGVEASFTPSSKVLHLFFVEDLPEKVKAWDLASGAPLKLSVKAGANYPDEVLRGSDVELEFVLEETRSVDLPALNDEFAKTVEKESMAALRTDLRRSMEDWKLREEDKKVEAKILAKIADATPMDLPEGLIESVSNRRRVEREYELLERGLPPEEVKETLVREGGVPTDQIRREMKEFFILERIADREKIFATEEEIDKRVYLMASLYGVSPGRLRDELRETGRLDELRFSMRHEKVRALLRQKARVLGPDGQAVLLAAAGSDAAAVSDVATVPDVATGSDPAAGSEVATGSDVTAGSDAALDLPPETAKT